MGDDASAQIHDADRGVVRKAWSPDASVRSATRYERERDSPALAEPRSMTNDLAIVHGQLWCILGRRLATDP